MVLGPEHLKPTRPRRFVSLRHSLKDPGVRKALLLTAAIAAAVLLLSAGLATLLWPTSQYSTETLDVDVATRIFTDRNETRDRRRSALSVSAMSVILTIRAFEEHSARGGVLGAVATQGLELLKQTIKAPEDGTLEFVGVARFEPLVAAANDSALSLAERRRALETLGREACHAVTCIRAATQDPTLTRTATHKWLILKRMTRSGG